MDSDSFVNGNCANVCMLERYDALVAQHANSDDDVMFDVIPGLFVAENGVQHDEVIDDDVVMVWKLAGEFVAWWDCENLCGFAA